MIFIIPAPEARAHWTTAQLWNMNGGGGFLSSPFLLQKRLSSDFKGGKKKLEGTKTAHFGLKMVDEALIRLLRVVAHNIQMAARASFDVCLLEGLPPLMDVPRSDGHDRASPGSPPRRPSGPAMGSHSNGARLAPLFKPVSPPPRRRRRPLSA